MALFRRGWQFDRQKNKLTYGLETLETKPGHQRYEIWACGFYRNKFRQPLRIQVLETEEIVPFDVDLQIIRYPKLLKNRTKPTTAHHDLVMRATVARRDFSIKRAP